MQDSNKETKKQPWRICDVFANSTNSNSGMVGIGRECCSEIDVFFNTLEYSNIKSLEQAQKIAEIIVNALNSQEDEQGN